MRQRGYTGALALICGIVSVLPFLFVALYQFIPSLRPLLPSALGVNSVFLLGLSGVVALMLGTRGHSNLHRIGVILGSIGICFTALMALVAFVLLR
ncbi:hypothetical protein HWQ67_17600 [Candidatus Magnetobacterium casensis]|uniref:Uncharacterized protein n=1 Tax=Candidatus Magnetobacterium casense TaxID=1455061 RepID=A0ABS6S3G9_9BACT|nr:hypothetical protein [Candidatus Magnetobacterium casensis]